MSHWLLTSGFIVLATGLAPFEDKVAGFRVAFPAAPERHTSAFGGTKETSFTVTTPTARFVVAVVGDPQLRKTAAATVLDGFRAASSYDAVVESEKKLTLAGVVGLELRTTGRNLEGQLRRRVQRMYVGKGRTWTVIVDVDAKAALESVGADAFLASFTITSP